MFGIVLCVYLCCRFIKNCGSFIFCVSVVIGVVYCFFCFGSTTSFISFASVIVVVDCVVFVLF